MALPYLILNVLAAVALWSQPAAGMRHREALGRREVGLSADAYAEKQPQPLENVLDWVNSAVDTVTSAVDTITDEVTDVSAGIGNIASATSTVSTATSEIARVIANAATAIQSVGDRNSPVVESSVARAARNVGNLSDISASVANIIVDMLGAGNYGTVSNFTGSLNDVADTIGQVAEAAADVVDIAVSLEQFLGPVPSGGHDTPYINTAVFALLGGTAALIGLGLALDVFLPKLRLAEGRPQWWLIAMLLASYAILIPGLHEVLFSFTLAVEMLGLHVTITVGPNGSPAPITDSMLSVIDTLLRSGSLAGGLLIVGYAIIVPAIKLLLLFVGELWRHSQDQVQVHVASWCIRFVQMISKWACPDMFVQILLLYLFRSLGDRSSLLAAPAHLDVGFSCFSIFCACSTFSTLAIQLPRPDPALAREAGALKPPLALRCCGQRGVLWITAVLVVTFSLLFTLGMILPCLGLRINPNLLVEPNGPLPEIALPAIDALHLSSQVNADVSMTHCIVKLVGWLYLGEANCILALLMLGGFAILLPVLSMLALLYAAAQIEETAKQAEEDESMRSHCERAMTVAHMLKHLSMLDVALMGVFVIRFASSNYREQGVEFILMSGLVVLACAEALHYIAYETVKGAMEFHVQGSMDKA